MMNTTKNHLDFWEESKKTLSKNDSVMADIISQYKGDALIVRGDAFFTLTRASVGQQISVKAADAIWKRLESMITLQPYSVLDATVEELRSIGLSGQKIRYLINIAEYFLEYNISKGFWDNMEDEEAIKHLTQTKGIGRWTAEMFLIFHLARPNVLPIDDIGLQKAVMQHYDVGKSDLKEHAERWQPYRSVATWYLWRSLDPIPVAY
jgi:DNA-3-methyladenine glycosylase II